MSKCKCGSKSGAKLRSPEGQRGLFVAKCIKGNDGVDRTSYKVFVNYDMASDFIGDDWNDDNLVVWIAEVSK